VNVMQVCPTAGSSSSVTIGSVDFGTSSSNTATLTVSGGNLDLGAATGTGTIDVSGGVSIKGSASTTISVTTVGTSGPLAVVGKDNTFTTNGDVTGTDGTVVVSGKLIATGTVNQIQPALAVTTGGQVTIDNTATNVGSLSVDAGATVVVPGGTNTIHIEKFPQCLGTINVALSAALTTCPDAGCTGTAFTYGSTNDPTALSKCVVMLVDPTGASVTLTSQVGATAAAGRRLLGTGSATWGSTSMTYTSTSADQKAPASSVFTAGAFALAAIATLFA